MRQVAFFARAAFVAAALAGFSISPFASAQAPAAPAPTWAFTRSDIPADPAIRFGTLPNGMRYALMKNASPVGLVSIRLRIGAGSLHETDEQQGLAHFLEHMAFRGSTHVPDGEVEKTLERLGLRMGADTNAATGQTQTTYRFDLPKGDDASLDTGLMLMREIASELTLDETAMDKERGVVLSEERLGDGPGMHAQKEQAEFLLKGQLAPRRFPIGKIEVIKNAPVEQLRAYYDAYFRPERAALVVVGDVDADALEAKIKARFGDWRNSHPAGKDPDLGQPAKRDLETALFTEAGARPFVSVSWIQPFDAPPSTRMSERKDIVDAIAISILNQRLARVAAGAKPPFSNAASFYSNNARSAKMATLSVTFADGRWKTALVEADKIRRQVLQQGVRQDEVDQEVAAILTSMQTTAARTATRQSPGLANRILADIDRDEVSSSAERDLEAATVDLKGLAADEVTAALRRIFTGNGPLIFSSATKPIEGGEAALRQAFLEAEQAVVADARAPKAANWSHTKFGVPSRVASRTEIADLGVTFIRFANGVRLTVKPTSYRAEEILVSVRVGAGRLAFSKSRPTVVWAEDDLISGGLKDIELVDMRRLLSSKIYGVTFDTTDDAFVLSGGTRPADFDLQLQVLAAYLTAPGWRPEAFHRTQSAWLTQLERADITPSAVAGAQLPSLLHSGDARWSFPKTAEIQSARPQDLKALLAPALARGPIEVVIVGDVKVDDAIAAVRATFGSLPLRMPAKPGEKQREVHFPDPTPTPVTLSHAGRSDQGLAFIAWPNTDPVTDMQEVANRRVLMDIFRLRITEQIRANNGASYSPSAGSQTSLAFPGYGYLDAMAEIPPEKMPLFFDTIASVAADLREKGPTADELERVRVPAVAAAKRGMQTNGFWAANLMGAQFDDRHLSLIRTSSSALEQVTAADVQRTARRYLIDDKSWKLTVVPKLPAAIASSPAQSGTVLQAN